MIEIEPTVVSIRRPFWQRVASFFEHVFRYKFPVRVAWTASRAERVLAWSMKITKEDSSEKS